jgi:hypothetical protein
MRMPFEHFITALEEKEFKNIHQSNHTQGLNAPDLRKKIEQSLFGCSPDSPPEDYPKYGYVYGEKDYYEDKYADKMSGGGGVKLMGYGNVSVVFKDTVKDRTTFCFGDSLNEVAGVMSKTKSPTWDCAAGISSMNDPKVESLGIFALTDITNERYEGKGTLAEIHAKRLNNLGDDPVTDISEVFAKGNMMAAEAQIKGKLSLDDIQEVIILMPDHNYCVTADKSREEYVEEVRRALGWGDMPFKLTVRADTMKKMYGDDDEDGYEGWR